MMKKCVLTMALFFSLAAQASDGASVCDELFWRGDRETGRECLHMIRDASFDVGIEDVCREVVTRGFPGSALMCLKWSKNKTYSNSEVAACSYYNTVNDPARVISCLYNAGQEN